MTMPIFQRRRRTEEPAPYVAPAMPRTLDAVVLRAEPEAGAPKLREAHGQQVSVTPVPAAFSADHLAGGVEVPPHGGHVLLQVAPVKDPWAAHRALLQVAAEACDQEGAVALLLPGHGALVAASDVEEPGGRLPLEPVLRVETDWQDDFHAESVGVVRGLHAWGLDDVEAEDAPVTPEELRQVLLGLAAVVLHQHRPLRDGTEVTVQGEPTVLRLGPARSGDGYALRLEWPKGVATIF